MRLDPMIAALLTRQHIAEFSSEMISSMKVAPPADQQIFLDMWTHRRDELVSQFWTAEVAQEMRESGIWFDRDAVVWTLDSVAFLIQYYWLPEIERTA